MKIRLIALTLTMTVAVSSIATAQQPNAQRRLGILGGLAGAGIGAAIGEDGGDAVPGAVIGGAIGLLSGAGIGGAIDQQEYRNQAHQAAIAQHQAQAVSMADVVSMTHAGLGDAVIIDHIRARGVTHRLNASDLIVLKQQGVSDAVLSAMQDFPHAAPVVRQTRPVIVQEHYYTHPSPAWWHHRHVHSHYRYGPPCRSRSNVHWGISFGN